jgi:hypothetical protein
MSSDNCIRLHVFTAFALRHEIERCFRLKSDHLGKRVTGEYNSARIFYNLLMSYLVAASIKGLANGKGCVSIPGWYD